MAKGTGSSGACSHGSLPERFIPCLHQGPDVEGGLQILCGLSLPISAPPSDTAPFHGQLYAQLCEMQKMLWSSVSNASWETEAGARSTSMVQAVSRINSQRLEESPP